MFDRVVTDLSIQEHPTAQNGIGTLLFWNENRPGILPAWGYSSARARELRVLKRLIADTFPGSAFSAFIKKIQSTPWELVGDAPLLVKRYQAMFQAAQFGKGWDMFIPKLIDDYLCQDKGAFIELIGRGDPSKGLRGAVMGMAHLDSTRCVLTGDPEFPVIYQARGGKMYRLHHTFVIHIVDSPDPEEDANDMGTCALSRLATLSTVESLMGQYHREKLGDLPPSGILAISGITDQQYKDAISSYRAASMSDGNNVFKNMIRITGIDPKEQVKIELTPFSSLPDHFDYEKFVNMHVNMVALALGVDKQEIWELSSGSLGSGAQSEILDKKSQGKGYGHLLQMLERLINTCILPDALEFRFKFKDSVQDADDAKRAEVWVSIAASAPNLSAEQRLQLLANNVPQFADVLLDDDGKLKVEDSDVKPVDDSTDVVAEDAVTPGSDGGSPDSATATDGAALAPGGVERDRRGSGLYRKSLQATRLDFEGDFEQALEAAIGGSMPRARFGIVTRALISKYGRQAYLDGLKDGGVDADVLEGDDAATYAKLVRDNSAYVTGVGDAIFRGDGVSESSAQSKPQLWFNKTITPFYQAGLLSADANGLYQWVRGSTEKPCPDCLRLNGQKHRLKDWHKNDWLPKSSKLKCSGMRCECSLKRAKGRVSGGF